MMSVVQHGSCLCHSQLKGEGEGGFDEFQEKLGDDILWGGFRCTGVDERGNLKR